MKQILKLGLVLAAYAVIACVGLAAVNHFTSPAIAAAKEAKASAGMKMVFAAADSFEKAADFTSDPAAPVSIAGITLAKSKGMVIGAVVEAAGPTYDKATMLIGIDLQRTITGIQFLSLTDTPGFGQKAAEPAFCEQFAGLSAVKPLTAGKDFDGLSGSSITTKGVTNIINYASWAAGEYLAANCGGSTGGGEAPVIAAPASPFTYEDAFISLFPPENYPSSDILFSEIPMQSKPMVNGRRIDKKYLVLFKGKPIALMLAVIGASYKSTCTVLVAVDMERTILGVRIIDLHDTPNVGTRVLEEDFYKRFTGKKTDHTLLIGKDLDGLSGATVSAACVADIVKVAAVEASAAAVNHGGKATPAGSENYALNNLSQEDE